MCVYLFYWSIYIYIICIYYKLVISMYLSSFIQFLYLQIVAVVFGASPGSQGLATGSFLSCFVQDDPPWGPEGLPWPALIIDQHD